MPPAQGLCTACVLYLELSSSREVQVFTSLGLCLDVLLSVNVSLGKLFNMRMHTHTHTHSLSCSPPLFSSVAFIPTGYTHYLSV